MDILMHRYSCLRFVEGQCSAQGFSSDDDFYIQTKVLLPGNLQREYIIQIVIWWLHRLAYISVENDIVCVAKTIDWWVYLASFQNLSIQSLYASSTIMYKLSRYAK